jgi:ferric-dicitrate binding protein FerR (iron transport regulator)
MPLGEAIQEANRYSARKLKLGDPELAGTSISAGLERIQSRKISLTESLPARRLPP